MTVQAESLPVAPVREVADPFKVECSGTGRRDGGGA